MEPPPPAPGTCPFCAISAAYPPSPPTSSIPFPADATSPATYVVLSTPSLLAFLDIMPLSLGHILICPRGHAQKVSDLTTEEGAQVGKWLVVLSRAVCKAVGVEDWNVVANNGAAAAQVVPHVHFHVIPRGGGKSTEGRSWTMFGRGKREELDDAEAEELAGRIRDTIRREVEEVEKMEGKGKL